MFTTTKLKLQEVQGLLETATTANVTLKGQLEKLTKELTDKDLELNTLKTTNVLKTDFDALQVQFTALTEKCNTLEKNNITAEEKAVEITASQGVPPVSVKPTADVTSTPNDDLLGNYEKLSGKPSEQRRYWEQNREALVALIRNKK